MSSEDSFDAEGTLAFAYSRVREMYAAFTKDLPFHGWHHIDFVFRQALAAAPSLRADPLLVGLAALLHDLNYAVATGMDAALGSEARAHFLLDLGLGELAEAVERIVLEAETKSRTGEISAEAKVLSDADSLYKCLPVTPVVLAPYFMRENNVGLLQMARKIVDEQLPLLEQGIYFYNPEFRDRYGEWARLNLELWQAILEAVEDPLVRGLLNERDLRA